MESKTYTLCTTKAPIRVRETSLPGFTDHAQYVFYVETWQHVAEPNVTIQPLASYFRATRNRVDTSIPIHCRSGSGTGRYRSDASYDTIQLHHSAAWRLLVNVESLFLVPSQGQGVESPT
jgi:hypothetical protein